MRLPLGTGNAYDPQKSQCWADDQEKPTHDGKGWLPCWMPAQTISGLCRKHHAEIAIPEPTTLGRTA